MVSPLRSAERLQRHRGRVWCIEGVEQGQGALNRIDTGEAIVDDSILVAGGVFLGGLCAIHHISKCGMR